MKIIFALTLILSMNLSNGIEQGNVLIEIENIKSSKGTLIIAAFDSKENFLKKPYTSKMVQAKTGDLSVLIKDLPYGKYAISIIHDENENGELDKNGIGLPKECFGFSNVSMGLFGPPAYKDVQFEVNETQVEVKVKMKDLRL